MSPSNSATFLQPEMLFNIDFRSPQFKKKSIEKHINSSSTVPKDGLNSPPLKRKSPITKATSSEMDACFENLMKSDKKPAILRILPGYAEKFRPKSLDTPCKSLKNLYSNFCLNMPFQYLQKKCNEIFESISISQDEALNIESQTKSQSKSQKWYEQIYIYHLYHQLKKLVIELNSEVLQQTGELNTKTQPKNVIFQFFQALMRI